MNLLHIFLLTIVFSITAYSQTYADKQFYLVDSLDLDMVDESEKIKLDSILELYHACDKKNDTLPFYYLEQLLTDFESADIEGHYRFKYLELAKKINTSSYTNHSIYQRMNYIKGYAYANVGIMYLFNSNQDTALVYLKKAIPFMNESDSTSFKALTYSVTSICYKNLNNLPLAIDYSMKALQLVEESKDMPSMGTIYNSLANLHQTLGNYDKANSFYSKVLGTIDSTKANYGIGLVNKANLLYNDLKDTIQAKKLLLQAEKLIDTTNSDYITFRLIKSVKYSLAQIYLDENNLDESQKYFMICLDIAKKINIKRDESRANLGLAEVNYKANRNNKALSFGIRGLTIGIDNNLSEELALAHKILYRIYSRLGNSKLALHHFEENIALENVFKEENEKKSLLQKSFQYDYDKKVKIDSLANQQKLNTAFLNEQIAIEKAIASKKMNYAALVIVLITAVLLTVIFSRLRIIRIQKKELDNAYQLLEISKKNELAASNLKAIKSQMNPHFIFNAINSVQDLVLQQETIKSYDYLVVFSKLVRNILKFSEKEFIPIQEEVAFLSEYLELEKLRFKDGFSYQLDSEIKELINIPSLIIQPFVENAIKHGLLHKKGVKRLSISLKIDNEQLLCTIVDNGVGRKKVKEIQARQIQRNQSFSTQAIKKRLELLGSKTGQKCDFETIDLLGDNSEVLGTKVILYLPIENTDPQINITVGE